MFSKLRKYNKPVLVLMMALAFGLVGCGGGGGTPPPADPPPSDPPPSDPPPVPTLSGTAAAGAAIIGQVTIKGSLGNTKSALIEADGNYTVDVTGLTAPYRLRAQGTVGGHTYKLHSYAVAADVGGNVNITPFTDLIIANTAQQVAESYFDSNTPADLDPAELDAQEDALQAKLQNIFSVLGVDTAIDLLNSTFSADHSGLDAALDIVLVEVDAVTNMATITNLVDGSFIKDNIEDTEDNSPVLLVDSVLADEMIAAVTDTQAIVAVFEAIQTAFVSGLPSYAEAEGYFADDFYFNDIPKGPFLTGLITDPAMIGTTFDGITVSNLDSAAPTVTFNIGANGVIGHHPTTWFVAKDQALGWQLRGDQRIVGTDFSFHCNDNNPNDDFPGACGINTQFWDTDFTNNGTGDVPIASGTVKIIDGTTSAVKATVYLGTPTGGTAGDVQVYDESDGNYHGDWKAFGINTGQINPDVFAVGDIIEHALYTDALDISNQAAPVVTGTPVAVYTDTLLFMPSPTETTFESNLYPTATTATTNAMSGFTLGNDLTISWSLAAGTRNSEVLVEVSDSQGNRIENWIRTFGTIATSLTVASSSLDAAAAISAGLDPNASTYNLKVRIFAEDELTDQVHSRDYDVTIPGPAEESPPPVALICEYESNWDAINDQPATFDSYDTFEAVVTECGGAMPIDDVGVIGTWIVTYTDDAGVWVETSVFNSDGTGTWTETLDGVEQDVLAWTWSITNNRITMVDNIGEFKDIAVVISDGSLKFYSEDTAWGSDLIFDATADGGIWANSPVKQVQ